MLKHIMILWYMCQKLRTLEAGERETEREREHAMQDFFSVWVLSLQEMKINQDRPQKSTRHMAQQEAASVVFSLCTDSVFGVEQHTAK